MERLALGISSDELLFEDANNIELELENILS